MESFIETIELDVPAAAAWEVVSDYARDVEWRTGVTEMRSTPAGPAAVGTVTHEVIRVGGRTYRNTGLVEDVVPGRRLSWRTTDGARAHGSRTVDPIGDRRCVLTLELHVVPTGVNRLLAPMLRRMLAGNLRKDLRTLSLLVDAAARQAA